MISHRDINDVRIHVSSFSSRACITRAAVSLKFFLARGCIPQTWIIRIKLGPAEFGVAVPEYLDLEESQEGIPCSDTPVDLVIVRLVIQCVRGGIHTSMPNLLSIMCTGAILIELVLITVVLSDHSIEQEQVLNFRSHSWHIYALYVLLPYWTTAP